MQKNYFLTLMETVKNQYEDLSFHNGFGFCAYGSKKLSDELNNLKIENKILICTTLRSDNETALSAQNGLKKTIMDFPNTGTYKKIKNDFIRRGFMLPKNAGHSVIKIDDFILDITSEQFYFPNFYSLKYLEDCWENIYYADVVLNNNSDDFFIDKIIYKEKIKKNNHYLHKW